MREYEWTKIESWSSSISGSRRASGKMRFSMITVCICIADGHPLVFRNAYLEFVAEISKHGLTFRTRQMEVLYCSSIFKSELEVLASCIVL